MPRLRALVTILVAATAARAQAPERRTLDLYQWMATAPTVLEGRVLGENGGRVETVVVTVLRGAVAQGERVLVELRRANAERDEERPPLKLPRDAVGLFLLEAKGGKPIEGMPVFRLVRGVDGYRPLPAEGKEAWIDAARQLAAIQEGPRNEERTWRAMLSFLEDPNPILVATSLSNHLRFDRGDLRTLAVLRPLLQHPRPDLRRGAAELCAAIVRRAGETTTPEIEAVLGELVARARRDDDASVRAAATRALGVYPLEQTRTVLETVARDDPEQQVRYEAERALYERGGRRSD